MFQFFELFMAKTTFSQICTTKHNVFTPVSSPVQMFSLFFKKLGEILCGYHLLSILNIPNIPQVREIGWQMIIYHLRCLTSFKLKYFLEILFVTMNTWILNAKYFLKGSSACCDIGQIDRFSIIELNPSFVLSSDNTNCKNDIQ